MILNISGRTDIVAFYSDWLMNRLDEGFIDVRNPFNPKMVSRIMMDDVDLLFFCTKNPIPIVDKLKYIRKKVYFHVTLTSYKNDIEPNVPSKKDIIDAIKKISNLIGKENIVIRYDPVFISDKYNVDYHIRAFDKICELLDGVVSKILIHFIDDYKNVRGNYNILKYRRITENDYETIGRSFSESAKKHNIVVFTCNEERNLTEFGLIKDDCIKKYPSYAKRMSGNSSVLIKQYNGYCIESDKGCIICHKNSNIIELYDRRFISQDTIDLLTKNTLNNYPLEKYISLIMKFNEVFNLYSNVDEMNPVSYTTKENKYINIYDNNKNYITMPELYYDVFEELLGFPEAGYITSDKKALYMKSEKGRALILRNRRKDDCLYE